MDLLSYGNYMGQLCRDVENKERGSKESCLPADEEEEEEEEAASVHNS